MGEAQKIRNNIEDAKKAIYYIDPDQPSAERLKNTAATVAQIQERCVSFLTRFKYFSQGFHPYFSQLSAADVLRTYSRDIEKMVFLDGVVPNIFRQASALAIWITRLRPLSVYKYPGTMDDHWKWMGYNINELLAISLAGTMVFVYYLEKPKDGGFINGRHFQAFRKGWREGYTQPEGHILKELVATLRYRLISRHSFSTFLEMDFEHQRKIALLSLNS